AAGAGRDAETLESDVVGVGTLTDGDEHAPDAQCAPIAERDARPTRQGVDAIDLDGEPHIDPVLAQRTGQRVGDRRLLPGQEPRRVLDQGRVAAEPVEHLGDLESDRPAPDHDRGLGQLGAGEELLAGPEWDSGQPANAWLSRPRPGGDDELVPPESPLARRQDAGLLDPAARPDEA